MKQNIKLMLGITLVVVLGVAVRVYLIWRERNSTMPQQAEYSRPVSDDDLVQVRKIYPATLADVRALIGKPLWVSAPGQFNYFPCSGKHADYSHSAGVLLGADRIEVKDVIEQVAPHSAQTRVPDGSRQVLIVFTQAKDAGGKLYAAPIGYVQDGYNLYLDGYFFYDDPHQMYHWPADIWQAIDQHREITGMNELQTLLAIGPAISVDSNDFGNRTAGYANNGSPLSVTFVHNKSTTITPKN